MKLKPDKDDYTTLCSTMGCRTYNGYDINWHDSWKAALEEVAKTGKLSHTVLKSPRQKDGRGNISPNTIILATLAEEIKLEQGKKIDTEVLISQMIKEFEEAESRIPTDEEVAQIRNFIENR